MPTNVKIPCQKIAEVKKTNMNYVSDVTDENVIKFFNLNVPNW